MMLVQFLVDYRGKLTKENYYLAGEQVEFDAGTAEALIAEGRAVQLVRPHEQAIAVPPAPAPEIAPAAPMSKRVRKQSSGGVL